MIQLLDLLQSKGVILYLEADAEGDYMGCVFEPWVHSVQVELMELIEENKLLLQQQIIERDKRKH